MIEEARTAREITRDHYYESLSFRAPAMMVLV